MTIRLNPLTAWAIGSVAVAATLLLAAGTPQFAAAVLACFLFVVVPGYALASAAFPLTTSGFVERSLIALVLGFVAAIAGGLLLHGLGGIEARGWLAWWAGIVLVAGSYVAWRTRRNRDEVLDVVIAPPAWRMSRRQAAYLVLALVIAGTSVRVARTGLDAQPQSTFTQFWMLPNAQAGFIDVGIANEEDQPTVYRVEIAMGDDRGRTVRGHRARRRRPLVNHPSGPGRGVDRVGSPAVSPDGQHRVSARVVLAPGVTTLRVLLVTDFYPPHIGGVELQVEALAVELSRRGHMVRVATILQPGLAKHSRDTGVEVHRLSAGATATARFSGNPGRRYHPPLPDPVVAVRAPPAHPGDAPGCHPGPWLDRLFGGARDGRA